MVVYWVHLEFAYGLCAKPFKHRHDYASWAIGFVGLALLMALVANLRLHGPARFRAFREARKSSGARSS